MDMAEDMRGTLQKASAGILSLNTPSITERTRQSIEKLQEELADKAKLLALLEKHPEVDEILRLMSKSYGNMY